MKFIFNYEISSLPDKNPLKPDDLNKYSPYGTLIKRHLLFFYQHLTPIGVYLVEIICW